MSQEIVERYRRANDAWNRRALDEWLNDITPGWELVPAGVFPDLASVYRGREGARRLWAALQGPWDKQGFHVQIERIEDLGHTVLALLTLRATGQTSGTDVALKWAHVITETGGDQHIRSYASWKEALEVVGLRE
jgi:SnoaL-like domain